jgi:LytS/YehU family sensor histidine kinase
MIVVIAGTIKLLKNWIYTQQQQSLLEKEKMEMSLKLQETEINLLKSQINPDFLFNALDSLYRLSREKSEIAPEVVIKISSLLDYMLYESTQDFVIIDKEMENIVNYLYLQNIKPRNIKTNSFDYQNQHPDIKIKPAILFPFIETLYRYSNQSDIQDITLDIKLIVNDKNLNLTIKRDRFTDSIDKIQSTYQPIKRILDIQYKENYELNFNLSEEILEINLHIKLINIAKKNTNTKYG